MLYLIMVAHDSVGGQPTVGLKINISEIAVACGYNLALSVSDLVSLEKALNTISNSIGPVLLEIKVKKELVKIWDVRRELLFKIKMLS